MDTVLRASHEIDNLTNAMPFGRPVCLSDDNLASQDIPGFGERVLSSGSLALKGTLAT